MFYYFTPKRRKLPHFFSSEEKSPARWAQINKIALPSLLHGVAFFGWAMFQTASLASEVPAFAPSSGSEFSRALRDLGDWDMDVLSDALKTPNPWVCREDLSRVNNLHERAANQIRKWQVANPNRTHAVIALNQESGETQLRSIESGLDVVYHALKYRFTSSGDRAAILSSRLFEDRGEIVSAALMAKGFLRDKAFLIQNCSPKAPFAFLEYAALRLFPKSAFHHEAELAKAQLKSCGHSIDAPQSVTLAWMKNSSFSEVWKEDSKITSGFDRPISNGLKMALAYGATDEETESLFQEVGGNACDHLNYEIQNFHLSKNQKFHSNPDGPRIIRFWLRYPLSHEAFFTDPTTVKEMEAFYGNKMPGSLEMVLPLILPSLSKEKFSDDSFQENTLAVLAKYPNVALPHLALFLNLLDGLNTISKMSPSLMRLIAELYEIASPEERRQIQSWFDRHWQNDESSHRKLLWLLAQDSLFVTSYGTVSFRNELFVSQIPQMVTAIQSPPFTSAIENLNVRNGHLFHKTKPASFGLQWQFEVKIAVLEKLGEFSSREENASLRSVLLPQMLRHVRESQKIISSLAGVTESVPLVVEKLLAEEAFRSQLWEKMVKTKPIVMKDPFLFEIYLTLGKLQPRVNQDLSNKIDELFFKRVIDPNFIGILDSEYLQNSRSSIFESYSKNSDALVSAILSELNSQNMPEFRRCFLVRSLGFLEKNTSLQNSRSIRSILSDMVRDPKSMSAKLVGIRGLGLLSQEPNTVLAEITKLWKERQFPRELKTIALNSGGFHLKAANQEAAQGFMEIVIYDPDTTSGIKSPAGILAALESVLVEASPRALSADVVDYLFVLAEPHANDELWVTWRSEEFLLILGKLNRHFSPDDYQRFMRLVKSFSEELKDSQVLSEYERLRRKEIWVRLLGTLDREVNWVVPELLDWIETNELGANISIEALKSLRALERRGGFFLNDDIRNRMTKRQETAEFLLREEIRKWLQGI